MLTVDDKQSFPGKMKTAGHAVRPPTSSCHRSRKARSAPWTPHWLQPAEPASVRRSTACSSWRTLRCRMTWRQRKRTTTNPRSCTMRTAYPLSPSTCERSGRRGYFDAEGNYLEYRLDAEDTDAWLESIMDEHRQVKADPELVARRRRVAVAAAAGLRPGAVVGGAAASAAAALTAAAAGGINISKGRRQRHSAIPGEAAADIATAGGNAAIDDEGDEEGDEDEDDDGPYDMHMLDDTGAELEDDERAVYQKRVADLLQPGETPLDGLRRLGKVMHGGAAATAVARTAAASAATATVRPPAVAADATVATENDGGGGGGDAAVVVGGAVPLISTPVGAARAGLGSLAPVGGDAGGTGASGSMVHRSCGERQRLRKQRREHQVVAGVVAVADPSPQPPPPPPPSPSQHPLQLQVEAGEAGKGEVVAAATELLKRSHTKNERKDEKGVSEGEGGRRAQSGGEVEMEDVDAGGVEALEPLPEPRTTADLRPADAPPSPAARQSVAEATAAAAARRRAPAGQPSEAVREARRQFDYLTSYANLLLSAGMYDVYNSTREQLLRAAQRTLGVDVVRSLTVAGLRPVGQVAAPGKMPTPKRSAASDGGAMAADAGGADGGAGGGGGGGGGANGKRMRLDFNPAEGADGPAGAGKEDELIAEGPGGGGGAAAGSDVANTATATATATSGPGGSARVTRGNAVDMDVDMFGGDEEGEEEEGGSGCGPKGGSARQAAADPGSGCAAGGDADKSLTVDADSPAAAVAAAVAAAAAALPGIGGGGATGPMAMKPQGCPAVAAAAGRQGEEASGGVDAVEGPAGALPDLSGFQLDPDSGYLYSSEMGYYYDTATGLYGDANTGLWYRYVAAEGPLGSGDDEAMGAAAREGRARPSGRFEPVAEQLQPVPEKQGPVG
ncbi:hypothetical protein Vretimale_7806 [Volvox reticuliferus]|uniref:OCRE domain-containing protein n=1 Tax=Volvox reticuliferus TaxID=1737510 RepID=A0A8J4G9X2_9CHLO|nr:hypothetical protein Vretimale_7806 [Volvox reticuliferus]